MAGRVLRDSRGQFKGSTRGWGAGKSRGNPTTPKATRLKAANPRQDKDPNQVVRTDYRKSGSLQVTNGMLASRRRGALKGAAVGAGVATLTMGIGATLPGAAVGGLVGYNRRASVQFRTHSVKTR